MSDTKKSAHSQARRFLIKKMQELNYGRIEHLQVENRDPVVSPMPRVVRDIKLGGESGPRAEAALEDFALRSQVIELFAHMDALGTGEIELIEVKGGLPFRVLVRQ